MQNKMRSFSQINEKAGDTAIFTFGRFNPPTTGHEKLIDALAKQQSANSGSKMYVFPSQSQNPKKDPLPFALKVAYMRKMFPKYAKNIMANKKVRMVFDIAVELHNKGHRSIVMVVGSDRVAEFESLLNKYNGVNGRHGYYGFDNIEVVSAGERDPDAEGVSGMSASKMRAAASDGDFDSFKTGVPSGFKDALKLYNDVRKNMGIREEKDMGEMTDFETLRDLYLTGKLWNIGDIVEAKGVSGKVINKGTNYLSFVDENNKVHKTWLYDINERDYKKEYANYQGTPEQIARRSSRNKARRVMGDKVVKGMDVGHKDNNPMNNDPSNLRNEDPSVNRKEPRLREVKQDKDVKDKSGTQPAKYFAKDADGDAMSKSTKDKRDAHFKAKKSGPAPGDSGADTKPSKHTQKFKQMYGEILGKDADMGDYIDDFAKSDAPQFKGKSKEKRKDMAIAAYLDKNESLLDKVNLLLSEDGHTDVASMKGKVQVAMKALQKMQSELGKLGDEDDLPTWWTNKVSTAVSRIDDMSDYLDAQVEELQMEFYQLDEKIEGLVTKAKKSGMPYGILKKVYDRGMAAYKTGHRPGTTAQQWAFARVNSFVTKSSGTWGKADKDLAKQVNSSHHPEEVELDEKDITYRVSDKKQQGNVGAKNIKDLMIKLKKMKFVTKHLNIYDKSKRTQVMRDGEMIEETELGMIPKKKRKGHEVLGTGGPFQVGEEACCDDCVDTTEGLWDNIRKKKERIARGSGEKMRKKGDKGAPTPDQIQRAKSEDLNEWGEVTEKAEYQGRSVDLNNPTKGDTKKYKVYVKNDKGNVVKVEFGDPNMSIKRDDPARRKSFRARHNCDQKKDKTTAGYWSCKFWSTKSVTDLMKG